MQGGVDSPNGACAKGPSHDLRLNHFLVLRSEIRSSIIDTSLRDQRITRRCDCGTNLTASMGSRAMRWEMW